VWDYQKLDVWRKAHELTLFLYRDAGDLSNDGAAGPMGQVRHAAAAIAGHIVEGCSHDTNTELAAALGKALASAEELQDRLMDAYHAKQLDAEGFETYESATVQIKRLLMGLIKRLEQTQ
jgi:four helix bundle protein